MPYKGIKPCSCRYGQWVAVGGTMKRVVLDCRHCGHSIVSSSAQANRLYLKMETQNRLDELSKQMIEAIGRELAFKGQRKTCDPAQNTDDAIFCAQWTPLFDSMSANIYWSAMDGWHVEVEEIIDVNCNTLAEAICRAALAAIKYTKALR